LDKLTHGSDLWVVGGCDHNPDTPPRSTRGYSSVLNWAKKCNRLVGQSVNRTFVKVNRLVANLAN
ncbi:3522_t:CDS:2, partial [Scutellospora calospora]